MSSAFWVKENQILGKKNVRRVSIQKTSNNNGIETAANLKARQFQNSEELINDLISKLQIVVNDKEKLQKDFTDLKKELNDIETKNVELLHTIQKNKTKFDTDMCKLLEDIRKNDEYNKKQHLEQERCYEEIRKLKEDNEQLRMNITKNEKEFEEKIKAIELEFRTAEMNCSEMKYENGLQSKKIDKYKGKLRYAISIINELNSILIKTTSRPDVRHSTSQTESDTNLSRSDSCSMCISSHTKEPGNVNENLLLSDIFFRTKSFCDNELMLINSLDDDLE